MPPWGVPHPRWGYPCLRDPAPSSDDPSAPAPAPAAAEGSRFLAVLGRHTSARVVVHGHLHADVAHRMGHTDLYGSPSTCHQIATAAPTWALVTDVTAGYRRERSAGNAAALSNVPHHNKRQVHASIAATPRALVCKPLMSSRATPRHLALLPPAGSSL